MVFAIFQMLIGLIDKVLNDGGKVINSILLKVAVELSCSVLESGSATRVENVTDCGDVVILVKDFGGEDEALDSIIDSYAIVFVIVDVSVS